MQGYLEIYAVKECGASSLVYESDNLITDGAREHMVDMLTYKVPPSGFDEDTKTGLTDVSAWTMAAMSIGPSRADLDRRTTSLNTSCSPSGNDNTFPVVANPADITLQPRDASNAFGHHLNAFEFSGTWGGLSQNTFVDASGNLAHLGSFIPGNLEMEYDGAALDGHANRHSCIDKNGFIYMHPDFMGSAIGNLGDSTSGVVVSGLPRPVAGAGLTELSYCWSIHATEVNWLRKYYGGIDVLGLWVYDVYENQKLLGPMPWVTPGAGTKGGSGGVRTTKSLYNFVSTVHSPKFKLFAKRTLFPDGLMVHPEAAYEWLTIVWRIRF